MKSPDLRNGPPGTPEYGQPIDIMTCPLPVLQDVASWPIDGAGASDEFVSPGIVKSIVERVLTLRSQ